MNLSSILFGLIFSQFSPTHALILGMSEDQRLFLYQLERDVSYHTLEVSKLFLNLPNSFGK